MFASTLLVALGATVAVGQIVYISAKDSNGWVEAEHGPSRSVEIIVITLGTLFHPTPQPDLQPFHWPSGRHTLMPGRLYRTMVH